MSDISIDLTTTPNKLLSGLSPEDMALLQPLLQRKELPARTTLEAFNQKFDRVHFIESGILSVVTSASRDQQIEIGIVGSEGVSGLPLILGTDRSPNSSIIQIPCTSLSMKTAALTDVLSSSDSLQLRLNSFVQAFLVQIAQTVLANSKANVNERLARWLVMAHDRVDGNDLRLTHESLSVMVGVRRAGITVALHELEGERLIRSTRGLITITDIIGLKRYANDFYGVAEAEYERLLGCPLARQRVQGRTAKPMERRESIEQRPHG
ncbi:Crp/Fnr family transcriptional regulator [Rhizorhapis sp. SPR117]|uniref:Crp/Fnr family transcriptional regulator n=1 Tax=Rhizorhapis sp. SPR117 TaxID=2912611 RepID=UPI001F3EDA78